MVLSITSNMMQPIFGYVMDRRNLSRILIPVIPFGAICICSIGLISTKFMLFIIIAFTGLSVSAFHPLGSTLVAKTAPSERQGRSMSYYIAGGNLGYALAPIIVIAFLDRFSMTELPCSWSPASSSLHLPQKRPDGVLDGCGAGQGQGLPPARGLPQRRHPAPQHRDGPALLHARLDVDAAAAAARQPRLFGHPVGHALDALPRRLHHRRPDWRLPRDRIAHKRIIIVSLALAIFPTVYFYLHPGTEHCRSSRSSSQEPAARSAAELPRLGQRAMPGSEGMASGMMLGFSFGLGSLGTAITAALGDQIGLTPALLISSLTLPLAAICTIFAPFPQKKE